MERRAPAPCILNVCIARFRLQEKNEEVTLSKHVMEEAHANALHELRTMQVNDPSHIVTGRLVNQNNEYRVKDSRCGNDMRIRDLEFLAEEPGRL